MEPTPGLTGLGMMTVELAWLPGKNSMIWSGQSQ